MARILLFRHRPQVVRLDQRSCLILAGSAHSFLILAPLRRLPRRPEFSNRPSSRPEAGDPSQGAGGGRPPSGSRHGRIESPRPRRPRRFPETPPEARLRQVARASDARHPGRHPSSGRNKKTAPPCKGRTVGNQERDPTPRKTRSAGNPPRTFRPVRGGALGARQSLASSWPTSRPNVTVRPQAMPVTRLG